MKRIIAALVSSVVLALCAVSVSAQNQVVVKNKPIVGIITALGVGIPDTKIVYDQTIPNTLTWSGSIDPSDPEGSIGTVLEPTGFAARRIGQEIHIYRADTATPASATTKTAPPMQAAAVMPCPVPAAMLRGRTPSMGDMLALDDMGCNPYNAINRIGYPNYSASAAGYNQEVYPMYAGGGLYYPGFYSHGCATGPSGYIQFDYDGPRDQRKIWKIYLNGERPGSVTQGDRFFRKIPVCAGSTQVEIKKVESNQIRTYHDTYSVRPGAVTKIDVGDTLFDDDHNERRRHVLVEKEK